MVEVEAESWADMVRTIDKERKQLPWDAANTQPVQRVSNFHRKRQEREFDPVGMRFRDPEREGAIQQKRETQMLQATVRAQDIKHNSFNIINHEGPPRRIETLPKLTKGQSQRPFHMLTNMPHNFHGEAPCIYDERFNSAVYKHTIVARAPSRAAHDREFNIINNDFFENPERKRKEEYERLRDHVLDKYWRTHDFDIIKGRYYASEKEQEYQQQRKVLEEVQGRALERTRPPSVEYADGHSYDILTHEVYDDDRLKATMTMADRSLNRMKTREKEAFYKERGEQQGEDNERKRMARLGHKRYENSLSNGFNFITNEVVTDRPQALPKRPPSMWARLTTPVDDNGGMQQERQQLSSGRIPPSTAAMSSRPDARPRDLSGAAPASSRPHTMAQSGRTGRSVPSLDITKADFGEPVHYTEPSSKAPLGLAVPMVRTGGFSSVRD